MKDLMQLRNNFVDVSSPNQEKQLNANIYADPEPEEQPDQLSTSKSNKIRYSLKKGGDFANQTTQMTRANSKDTMEADKASQRSKDRYSYVSSQKLISNQDPLRRSGQKST
jgi:hypothetical protein